MKPYVIYVSSNAGKGFYCFVKDADMDYLSLDITKSALHVLGTISAMIENIQAKYKDAEIFVLKVDETIK